MHSALNMRSRTKTVAKQLKMQEPAADRKVDQVIQMHSK